jgi:hypothetical protein
MSDLDALADTDVMHHHGQCGNTAYAIEQLIARGPNDGFRCPHHRVEVNSTCDDRHELGEGRQRDVKNLTASFFPKRMPRGKRVSANRIARFNVWD